MIPLGSMSYKIFMKEYGIYRNEDQADIDPDPDKEGMEDVRINDER